MDGDSARQVDGFNSGDFHGRNFARDLKLSPSALAIVNIIVDNIAALHVEWRCRVRSFRRRGRCYRNPVGGDLPIMQAPSD
jgi:hypothetical protein